jgi:hypothetical protein
MTATAPYSRAAYVVHLGAGHKRVDLERFVGLGDRLGDLLGLQSDVIPGAGLVALHLLFGPDGLAGFGVDERAARGGRCCG